jgi:murein DD-endopeptidase MepM/ murein hydrolase activator NlpD
MVCQHPIVGRIRPEVIGLKPTRGLSGTWQNLPRERRVAMASLALLLALLGSLFAYEKWTRRPPGEDVQPMSEVPPFAQSAPVDQAAAAPTPEPVAEPAAEVVAAPQSLLEPLGKGRAVMQPFGLMHSDVYGDYRLHPGIDYAAKLGESVVAGAAGKVVSLENDPVEGRVIEVDHGGGMTTRYGGLDKVLVTVNTTVQPGTIVGLVGKPTTVKQSMGTHLHFEVLLNGNPQDPTNYFRP